MLNWTPCIARPQLRSHVECIWSVEGCPPPGASRLQRILPDGCMELVFHYGDSFRRHDTDAVEVQPRFLVVGEIRRFLLVEPTGALGVLGVRLKPGAARDLFPLPLGELGGQVLHPEEVWGAAAREVESRLREASTHQERVDRLEDFLLRRLERRPQRDPIVQVALEAVFDSGGRAPVAGIAAAAGCSVRRLERRFLDGVGLAPKPFSRIVRFQQVVRRLEAGQSMAHAAFDSGFFDQPHLSREFLALAGLTPRRYLEEAHPLSDFFTTV